MQDTSFKFQIIPRLVDSAGQSPSVASLQQRGRDNGLDPASWNVDEVARFLSINECATLAESFKEQVGIHSYPSS